MTDDESNTSFEEISRRNYEKVMADIWRKIVPPPRVSPLSEEPLQLTNDPNVDPLLGVVVEEAGTGIRFCVVALDDGDPVVEYEGDVEPTLCEYCRQLVGIYERSVVPTLTAIWPHVEKCIFCQIEAAKLHTRAQQIVRNRPNPIVEIIKDGLVGLAVLAGIGLFYSARGIADAYNQRQHDTGASTPPWFRPQQRS